MKHRCFGAARGANTGLLLTVAPAAILSVLIGANIGHAQQSPPAKPPSTKSQPSEPALPPGTTKPGAGPPGAMPNDPLHMPIPERASERQKLLDNLYAYLAAAGTESEAQPIAVTIERLWMMKGTDTSAYLMERAARAVLEKDLDLALSFLDRVVDLAPDYAEGWNRRAYVHFLRDNVELALGDLRRCLALEPGHFRALEATAAIFKQSGQKAAALKAYQKLNEIHPNLPGLAEALKEMARAVEGQKT